MPRYIVRHVPAGDGPIIDSRFTGTKDGAIQFARRIAEVQYPEMTVKRGGGDALTGALDAAGITEVEDDDA